MPTDNQPAPAWADKSLSPDERARLLLDAATLEEKLHMLHGTKERPPDVNVDGYVSGLPRLGVPELFEVGSGAGLTGLARATALPAPIAQAATWDQELSYRCGAVIGLETRTFGANVSIGGCINIARVPLNGRTFEAYGEDPFLTARMIVAHIRGIQAQGVVATVKHYALNNQETNRGDAWIYPPGTLAADSQVDERTMREIYLPAFEAAVKEAEVGVVMTAYNRVNGSYASQNRQLIREILKDEWGFSGWTVSDWISVHDTLQAIEAGLDQEMPFGDYFGQTLLDALSSGQVQEDAIDERAFRIWRTMFRFGLFDGQDRPSTTIAGPDNIAVAEEVATASAVLLKNDGLLPLDRQGLRKVALIGADANATGQVVAGGGSAHVLAGSTDTLLEALRARVPGVEVELVGGTDPVQRGCNLPGLPPVPSSVVRTGYSRDAQRGLLATYYSKASFKGQIIESRVEPYIGADWHFLDSDDWALSGDVSSLSPSPPRARSAVWEGVFSAPVAGTYTFDLTSREGSVLLLDGHVLVDNGGRHDVQSAVGTIELEEGSEHWLRVEYSPETEQIVAQVKLGWKPPQGFIDPRVLGAAEAARAADVAVVVARDLSTEDTDKASLSLPNQQDELITAVASANPRTVVVLQTGGPVLMPWVDSVPAVLEAWYGGSRAGNAIARLLIGESVPSGKLPVTFPRSEAQLPTVDKRQFPGTEGVVAYSEGLCVGYRHYDAAGLEPLFPFGHGLSYTRFGFSDLGVTVETEGGQPRLLVRVTVTNLGEREGKETVQVYLGLPAEAEEPPRRLVGFQQVSLLPGESRSLSVPVQSRELSIWDTSGHCWRVPRGTYKVAVGPSSRSLPLQAPLQL